MAAGSSKLTHCLLATLRWAAGGVFIWAGVVKALQPDQFLIDLRSYRLLPYSTAVAVALYLPWLEIFCGLSVIVRRFYGGALLLLLLLTLTFTVAIGSAWQRGIEISCGCFGSGSEADYPELIVRDLGVLLLVGILAIWHRRSARTAKTLTCAAAVNKEVSEEPRAELVSQGYSV